jgi:hypothetical protein
MMLWRLSVLLLCLGARPILAKEPELSCERKIGAMTWQGMEFRRYKLRAENFPPRQNFRLIVKSFDGTRTETFKYSANSRGHLILKPPEDLQGEIYAICPVKRGERLTFSMQSEEGDDSYETEVVPFPLEMRSKKGIQLTLELQGEKGDQFLLFAQGFKGDEEIGLFLEVNGKRLPKEAQITRLGDLCTPLLLPSMEEGGEAKLIIVRKSEEIVFPFAWGAGALKYVGACCFEIR